MLKAIEKGEKEKKQKNWQWEKGKQNVFWGQLQREGNKMLLAFGGNCQLTSKGEGGEGHT